MMETIILSDDAEIGGRRIPKGAALKLDGNSLWYEGQKLQLGLTPADVHDPTEMPTYLAGYSNEEFRHMEICQIILVDKDEDKFRTFDSTSAFSPVAVKTDDDAAINEIRVTSSLTNYKVQSRRLGAFIPDTVASQANPNYDVRFVHMERCARAINMDLELDVLGPSGLLTTVGNWASGYATTLASGFQWGGASGVGTNSNPVADIRGRINKSAHRITDWWFNQRAAGLFLDNPEVRDYTRFKMGDAALDAAVKAVFEGQNEDTIDFNIAGLGRFHVACAKYLDSSANLDYIMPDCLIGVTQPPGRPTNGEKIATAYNFRRKGPQGNGFNTREVRIEQRGVGGTLVIAEEASVPTFTGTIVGGAVFGVSQ